MSEPKKLYENLAVKKLPKSEVEVEADIPWTALEKQWPKALKRLNESANLPGFRPGHIPENVLTEKLGELRVVEEAADILFPEIVFDIFSARVPNAIGRPKIHITKLARGSELHFKVMTAVLPEIVLPDYASIAAASNNEKTAAVAVEEKEIESVLTEMQKAIADREKKEPADVALDDGFAKKIGNFPNLGDLKSKIKDNLIQEKTLREAEKKRQKLLDAVVEKTPIELPDMLVQSEMERIIARFEDDIAKMGLKVDSYLEYVKKTRDDLKKEWLPQAEKNAKLDLILATIAKEKGLMPPEDAVEAETKHILSHHKDAAPESVRSYVTMVLTHQKVFEFLELQK